MALSKIFSFIPEVRNPPEKKVDFNTKLKWTLIVLCSFFVLANIPLYGLSNNFLENFKYLAIILGTEFGSIISLGIGPIVMASIILQLLSGAGIINIDQTTQEGKKFYTGIQKLLILFFIFFEAFVFVMMKGLQAAPGFAWIVILQLCLGGLAIFYMDDLVQKWGFGSGVSLFIAAGVSWRLFTTAFQVIDSQGRNCLLDFKGTLCSGQVWVLLQSIVQRYPQEFLSSAGAILATVLVYLLVVWAQSLKVEIPLSFGKYRGYLVKWPLSFFYTGVIPVILTAALIANLQLFSGMLDSAAQACYMEGAVCSGSARIASWFSWTGRFSEGIPISGLSYWFGSTNLLELWIRGGITLRHITQGITHVLFFVFFSTLFAVLWSKTTGLDAESQAQKISSSGMQVAGFRQDTRILESILDRYVLPLTIMGGLAIGLLSSVTDLIGAMVGGTSILLVIMIMFQFYQSIAQQHSVDMNPAMKKFMGA